MASRDGAAIYNSDGVLRDAKWWGLSGTDGLQVHAAPGRRARGPTTSTTSKNGGGLLGYSFDDGINGIGRGLDADGSFAKGESVGANRYALSLGMNYLFDENTNFKVEYRYDGADQPVFESTPAGATTEKSNQLFGASVVVRF
jgi:long-subunit fatty acid transport protein